MKARLLVSALALLVTGCGLTAQQIGVGVGILGGAVEGARRAGVFGGGPKSTPGPMLPSPQCDDARGPRCDCWRSETGENVWSACVPETCPVQVFTPSGQPSLCRRDVPCPAGKSAMYYGAGACDWYCNPCEAPRSPTPPPHPTPPFTGPMQTVETTCVPGYPSVYSGIFLGAQRQYREQHPEQFDGSVFRTYDARGGYVPQEVYMQGLCDLLSAQGFDCLVDRGGDISLADRRHLVGTGFSESYHPIEGHTRKVQTGLYLERCTPRWFGTPPRWTPTTAPTPSQPAVSAGACPGLRTFSGALLGDRFPGEGVNAGKTCRWIDWTARLWVTGCNNPAEGCPCNFEKPTCGTNPPNLCEPPTEQVQFSGTPNVYPSPPRHPYRQQACGVPGEPFTARAHAPAGMTDRSGRPLDTTSAYDGVFSGAI